MKKKNYTSYTNSSVLERDINRLSDSIDNIGNNNIINNSKLAEIENDIQKIENRIKITNRKNMGKICIRNIKIFGRALQGIFPYLVCAGIVFTVQSLIGDIPFYPQDVFKIAQHEQVIDNNGPISDNVKYVMPNSKTINSAHYSTKWEKKDDGKYYRMIKEYNIGEYTIDELREFVKQPDLDFEETFGKNISIKYEVKNEDQITKEELEEGTGFKIVYRYTDEEDVVLRAQDIGENIGFSALYLLFTFLLSMIVELWREESDFDFSNHVENYMDKYQIVDIKKLEKLFEEKKIKFELVKHQQVSFIDPINNEKILIKS